MNEERKKERKKLGIRKKKERLEILSTRNYQIK